MVIKQKRILNSIQSINLENLEIAYVYRKGGAETIQENIAAVALKEVKDRESSWECRDRINVITMISIKNQLTKLFIFRLAIMQTIQIIFTCSDTLNSHLFF